MGRNRKNTVIQLGLTLLIMVFLYLVSGRYFTRFDLTAEKRYSVSEVSEEILTNLERPVLLTVYLAGEMPTRYKKLQTDLETFLYELSIASDGNLDYVFVDPTTKLDIYGKFARLGMQPFSVAERISPTETKSYQLLPFAELKIGKVEVPIDLVKGCVFRTQRGFEISTEKTYQNFEYNVVSTVYNYARDRSKVVGMLSGHGEYGRDDVPGLVSELERYYSVLDVNVRTGEAISPSIDVLLVMQPDSTFTEREKYEIDQYLMRGGKMVLLSDNEIINFDIGAQKSTLTQLRDLNLDDFLMRMGVKINYNIVQDYYCDPIKVVVDNARNPQQVDRPWVFHPLLEVFPPHPTTQNLDNVSIRFGSSIDTTVVPGIEKEVILFSSPYSRTIQGTQYIDVNTYVNRPIPRDLFTKGPITLGVVLKGKFPSLFQRRKAPVDEFAPEPPTALKLNFNPDTASPKIAIISDGELGTGTLFRGQYRNTPADNQTFLVNVIDFLSGDNVMTRIRSKEVSIRELDREKVGDQRTLIQFMNIAVPVLLILGFGFVRAYLRRRKNLRYKTDV